jgi:hypothetical protein
VPGFFDPKAWNGERPLVEPLRPAVDGDVPKWSTVWERVPEAATHEARGGIVVDRGFDPETGEAWADVLYGRPRQNRFEVHTFRLAVNDLSGETVERPTHSKMQRAARQICRALGERQAAYFSDRDFWLLMVAAEAVHDSRGLDSAGRQVAS